MIKEKKKDITKPVTSFRYGKFGVVSGIAQHQREKGPPPPPLGEGYNCTHHQQTQIALGSCDNLITEAFFDVNNDGTIESI